MSLRKFTDSAGQDWEAYDVVPRTEERRRYDRRSGEVVEQDVEDRRDADRRTTVGGAEHLVAKAGWLCFESHEERRRLTPIPEDWARCDDATLETYLRNARVPRLSGEYRSIK